MEKTVLSFCLKDELEDYLVEYFEPYLAFLNQSDSIGAEKVGKDKTPLVQSKKSKDVFDDEKSSAVERFDYLKIHAFKATLISI